MEERVVARSTRFTSSEEADRATTFNPTASGTHAPQGGGECGWQVVKKEEEGEFRSKREGGGEVGVQHRQL